MESSFDPTRIIEDEHLVEESPCGKYQLVSDVFGVAEDSDLSEIVEVVLKNSKTGETLVTMKRNDSRLFYSWISRDGHDYFLLSEDLEGQSIIDLTEHRIVGFCSRDDPFIWTEFHPSPDKSNLAIIGCYWACPYQVSVYDFRRPMELPLPKVIQFTLPDNNASFGEWTTNTSFSVIDDQNTVHSFHVPQYS